MANKVVTNFANRLKTVHTRNGTDTIKTTIGDSLNNNRVPTVNQMIRFLTSSDSTVYRSLGRRLRNVHNHVKSDARLITNLDSRRTDAVDLSELVTYLNLISTPPTGQEYRTIRNLISS